MLSCMILLLLLCGCSGAEILPGEGGEAAGGMGNAGGRGASDESEISIDRVNEDGADTESVQADISVRTPVYATQYSLKEFPSGYIEIAIEDGLKYLLIPEGMPEPDEGEISGLSGYTRIHQPVNRVYLAASSAMDMFDALDCLERVRFTSTQEQDWSLPHVREAMASERLDYIGKYNAPDYEAILEEDTDLAIESTMVYHSPEVKEELAALGVPVLVERSSYEHDPLGRLEWIRLYGLLLGKQAEADAFFDEAVGELSEELGEPESSPEADPPTVAFFSISDSGYATIRKNGDYITRMIEMAGGRYVPADEVPEEENALSTMNIQMEQFYEDAADCDILIYNSTIRRDIQTTEELLDRSGVLEDFRAVSEGRVWCTNKNVYQQSTGIHT